MSSRHPFIPGVLAAAALLLLPSAALADGSARIEGSGSAKTLRVEAGAFDGQNALIVNTVSGAFEVTEFAQNGFTGQPKGLDAGNDCTQLAVNRVRCPTSGVSLVRIETKGGPDRAGLNESIAVRAHIDVGADDDLDVSGGAGDDLIVGGSGTEEALNGGPGDDTIFGDETGGGGSGDDLLNGGDGDDTLRGGRGVDDLNGGGDDDTLVGGEGVDDLNGSAGDDVLDGGEDADSLAGGSGTDRADYSARGVPLLLSLDGTANDGSADDGPSGARDNLATDVEDLVGGSAADTLIGDEDPNVLNGRGSDDVLSGRGGDDTLIGSTSADFLHGGSGTGDLAFYADHAAGVTVTMGDDARNDGNAVDQNAAGFRDRVSADVENVLGTAAADDLTGGAEPNVLDGGAGADRLRGGGGSDFVTYASRSSGVTVTMGDALPNDGNTTDGPVGARDDVRSNVEGLIGTPGADTIVGNASGNLLRGEGGADALDGAQNDDVLDGGTGADDLRGGAGTGDAVTYATRISAVNVSLDDVANDGNGDDGRRVGLRDNARNDIEDVLGSSAGDALTGSSTANRLDGNAGGDTLRGGPGEDALLGREGDDLLDGGADADVSDGGQGADTVDYSQRTTPVDVDLPNLVTVHGGAEDGPPGARDGIVFVENAIGGSGADRLVGTFSGSVLTGGPGADTLQGREGDDVLRGGPGPDSLAGGAGTGDEADYSERTTAVTVTSADGAPNDGNAVDGPAGARDTVGGDIEVLRGGGGDDDLTGRAVADRLFGGGGSDRLAGAGGDDALFGEAGSDTFLGGGGGGADAMHGGNGIDLASYEPRNAAVNVSLNAVADDGGSADGFADDVGVDVENVTGSSAGDTITGSDRANVLLGGGGPDAIDAGTTGETATDTVDGGAGNDLIDTNESAPDVVSCGADSDGLTADLKDGPPGFADCEAVAIAAFDQHPTVEILTDGERVKERGPKKPATARVDILCPDSPSHGCAGQISLGPAAGGATWDSAPYALRPGHRTKADLELPDAVLDELRRRGSLAARAIVTDRDTTGRPKTTAKTIELLAKGFRG